MTLVYLPHLDYDHQRYGPDDPRSKAALCEVDRLVGELLAKADEQGTATVVLSEYGIERVTRAILPNRVLREAGLLAVRSSPIGETLDTFASRAFAVVDHQVAHVYARDESACEAARQALAGQAGIARVLSGAEKREARLDHPQRGRPRARRGKGQLVRVPVLAR